MKANNKALLERAQNCFDELGDTLTAISTYPSDQEPELDYHTASVWSRTIDKVEAAQKSMNDLIEYLHAS